MHNIDKLWREHAELREGVVYKVYLDSVKKPTGGIGHLLTPAEKRKLKVGSAVSEKQVEAWFKADSATAKAAAEIQAREIGVEEDWFIVALISVNFQLGTNWINKFHTTYPKIVLGDFQGAVKNLRKSKWYKQTPVRVEDFILALQKAEGYKKRPLVRTRTFSGATVAGVSTLAVAAETIADVTEKIEPLTGYSEVLTTVFLVLSLVGIGLVMYARKDDRKKGLR